MRNEKYFIYLCFMPINKKAYRRYKVIDACLRNKMRPYPKMEDLIDAMQEKLDVSTTPDTVQKDIAAMKIDSATGKEKDFFEGKIAAARYFVHNFLPLVAATRAIVEREDGEIMKVSEGAF